MRNYSALGLIFANMHDESFRDGTAIRSMGSLPFGGRYRLIDFPLSAMVNAGITKVGVITKRNGDVDKPLVFLAVFEGALDMDLRVIIEHGGVQICISISVLIALDGDVIIVSRNRIFQLGEANVLVGKPNVGRGARRGGDEAATVIVGTVVPHDGQIVIGQGAVVRSLFLVACVHGVQNDRAELRYQIGELGFVVLATDMERIRNGMYRIVDTDIGV